MGTNVTDQVLNRSIPRELEIEIALNTIRNIGYLAPKQRVRLREICNEVCAFGELYEKRCAVQLDKNALKDLKKERQSKRQKARYAADPETFKRKRAEYYKLHREKVLTAQREYYKRKNGPESGQLNRLKKQ